MPSVCDRANQKSYDAIVIGAGPNGLSAAIVFAQNGLSTLLIEAQNSIGGGCKSAALTLPGYIHDICSAIHPLGIGSPFFRTLPLAEYGLTWAHPEAPFAHPFDNGEAAVVHRSVEATAFGLGIDEKAYLALFSNPKVNWDDICDALLNPLEFGRHPFNLARFGLRALLSTEQFAHSTFKGKLARGLFAGISAHACLPLHVPTSAAIGMVLGMAAHAVGWPAPKGGAQNLADALASHFRRLGGEIITACPIAAWQDLPPSRLILFDLSPEQILKIAGSKLPDGYKKALSRYRYGPAVCKLDWALDGPIPWQAAEIARAGTVHVGGTIEEIAKSEEIIWQGKLSEKPYLLLAQHTIFDPSRAPTGKHTAWAYCHVPNGANADMTAVMENQIERFAPGFKKLILQRHILTSEAMTALNANYVGGDINGGALLPSQLFTRPLARLIPYATPVKGMYICSASTPPGPGVHGMCGYYAAMAALKGWQ